MARETRNAVLLNEVRTLFGLGVIRDSSDGELLGRFLNPDDSENEAAFTFLVERHGPMVLHVCRQVLDDSHDAQDAFQATFLVFLRRAGSIRKRDSVASWLFGVAVRVARRARFAAIVRRIHEQYAGELAAAAAPPANEYSARLAELHEAIARLPDRYREPIVLCHLEGLSTAAAAQRLGCPQGTILSRLARGRERLRKKLCQQGQVESMGMLAATWGCLDPMPAMPAALVNSTAQYSVPILSGRAIPAATVSPSVATLTQATLRTLFMTRIMLGAALLATAAALTVVTSPIFRPGLKAGSQAAPAGKAPPGRQEKPQTIEQGMLFARDMEDTLYKILKRDHEFNDPRWTFMIKVRDVQQKTLIDATFKHRAQETINEYDAIVQAKRAVLRFDLDSKIVRAFLEDAETQRFGRADTVVLINNRTLEIPIPAGDPFIVEAMRSKSRKVRMHSDQALSLAYSSDGKTVATAGLDGVAHLWNMTEAKEVATLKGENGSIRSVSFAPDGKTLACLTYTGPVTLWDVATGKLKRALPGMSDAARQVAPRNFVLDAIAFAPDGDLLAVAGKGQVNGEMLGYCGSTKASGVRLMPSPLRPMARRSSTAMILPSASSMSKPENSSAR
jgi:RNA polymerase sigma factor (sigma-70 family)